MIFTGWFSFTLFLHRTSRAQFGANLHRQIFLNLLEGQPDAKKRTLAHQIAYLFALAPRDYEKFGWSGAQTAGAVFRGVLFAKPRKRAWKRAAHLLGASRLEPRECYSLPAT